MQAQSIGVGKADWFRLPLPPNRTGGFPASGFPVSGPSSWKNQVVAVGGLPSFGQEHFGACDLEDPRLIKRAVITADAFMRHPGGTLPQKLAFPETAGHERERIPVRIGPARRAPRPPPRSASRMAGIVARLERTPTAGGRRTAASSKKKWLNFRRDARADGAVAEELRYSRSPGIRNFFFSWRSWRLGVLGASLPRMAHFASALSISTRHSSGSVVANLMAAACPRSDIFRQVLRKMSMIFASSCRLAKST